MKLCSRCGKEKDESRFWKDSGRKDGIDNNCIDCRSNSKKEKRMNETRFKSIVAGLTSTAKKVFDAVPNETYWSSTRIQSEMFRSGSSLDRSKIEGSLRNLVELSIVIEPKPGLFSRIKSPDKAIKKKSPIKTEDLPTTCFDKPFQEEKKIMTENAKPFDAVREVAIKFLDVAKTINALASEIDLKLADVEKHMATNDQDTAKLKQLQVLLKSLG